MKILGLIPARGGSKGIPGKNLAPLCGKPLIQWTIEAAKESGCFDRIVLSTDDQEIAGIASLDITHLRPSELATDDSPVMDTVNLFLDMNAKWGAVFLLQPTNPLRTAEDIRQACAMLEAGAQSVVSYSPVGEVERLRKIDRVLLPIEGDYFDTRRRQDLNPAFIRDGSVYLATVDNLREYGAFENWGAQPFIIPRERSVRIDEPFDLEYAEFLLTRQAKMAHNT